MRRSPSALFAAALHLLLALALAGLLAGGCGTGKDSDFEEPHSTSQGGSGGTGGSPPAPLCEPGSTAPCYSGPEGSEGVGICKGGVMTCTPDGMHWGDCEGAVYPAPQDCATPTIDEACTGDPGPCTNPPFLGALYGTAADERGEAVAADPQGNILLTGVYSPRGASLDFGAGPIGPGAMFLVKLDPGGGVLWQKGFSTGYPHSVRSDPQGNVILYGHMRDSDDFGPLDLGGGPLFSPDGDAVFLAKYDAGGNHLFSEVFLLGESGVSYYEAAVGPASEIVITGTFRGTIDLGGGPLVSLSDSDIFVAKLDAGGALLWSARFGGPSVQFVFSVAVDAGGNVVVAGGFEGTIDFGDGPIASKDRDVFVAKLDPAGAHLWSRALGGQGDQYASSAAVDPAGNVLFAGFSPGPIDLGGGDQEVPGTNATCFLGKLSPDGAYQWSRVYGCHLANIIIGPRLATDTAGNALVTASFNGVTDLGLGPVWSIGTDAFALQVSPEGTPAWVLTFSSADYDTGLGVAADPAGNAILTGLVSGDVDLGAGMIPGNGKSDVYLVKLPP